MEHLMSLDATLAHTINGFSGHLAWLDASMTFITLYGIYLFVGLVAVRWFWHKAGQKLEERYLCLVSGMATAVALGINQMILLFVDRPRPYTQGFTQLLIEPSADPSFPSDHATLVFAVAVTFLMLVPKRGIGFFGAGLLIALSRVYAGTHFPSDILAGGLIGVVCALTCVKLISRTNPAVKLLSKIL